jgi:UDP-N-acetyl-2-amino-2-deoxyglucuronate dehydrogenase
MNNKDHLLGVLLVGTGNVATSYLEYFRESERARLVAIADPNKAALQQARLACPCELAVEDYRTVLDRPEIDVVLVCTPHYLHHPVVCDALRAGKDVLSEKPIAVNLREADAMIDLAADQGRQFFVSLNMRFEADARHIRQLVQQEDLGRIVWARAAYLGYEIKNFSNPDHWKGDLTKAGGGVLLDGGYHVVDLLNSYFGKAKHVNAQGGRLVIETPGKGEDNVTLLVEYESGVIADLVASFTTSNVGCDQAPTLMLSMDLSGTEGTLFSGYDSARLKRHLDVVKPSGRSEVDLAAVGPMNKNDHFFDCFRDQTEPMVTAIDARNATAVVEAAYQSIKSGQRTAVDWRDS